jgi:hypothetical protein
MAETANFNKLVSVLPIEERHNLLERLKAQSTLSSEILYVEEKGRFSSDDIGTQYSRLPWFYRLWYYLQSLFKSRDPVKVFEDNKVALLGTRINERVPGLYDYQRGMLLPLFYRQMARLKEAAHFFYSALDSSVNRDRGAFFAFLGSLEMPNVHKILQNETNPLTIAEEHPDTPEHELRQIALKSMDEAFALITEEKRNAMYFDARTLYCLKELSSFLYDRVLLAFDNSSAGGGECSAGIVRDLLITLNNILFSLKVVPPMTLLESLFIFILQEKAGEHGFDINREIHLLLSKAEACLAVIQDFNSFVPLTWVLRCSARDMALSPQELSGGEDWFVVYRDYWKKRIDTSFIEYLKEKRQKELRDSFRHFLKDKELRSIGNVQTNLNPDGVPIKGAFGLSFLYTFYPVVFMPDINWVLRPILIEGEFQKIENRMEFTEGYNNLIKLEDEIKKIELDIATSGDFYKRYAQARLDMSSLPVKRRKIQIILEEVEEQVDIILEQTREAAQIMVDVLNGILGKDSKGKYFPLTNLPKVVKKDSHFIPGINDVIQKFQFVLKVLDDIGNMESLR